MIFLRLASPGRTAGRWAQDKQGAFFAGEPEVPEWVQALSRRPAR